MILQFTTEVSDPIYDYETLNHGIRKIEAVLKISLLTPTGRAVKTIQYCSKAYSVIEASRGAFENWLNDHIEHIETYSHAFHEDREYTLRDLISGPLILDMEYLPEIFQDAVRKIIDSKLSKVTQDMTGEPKQIES